MLLRIKYPNWDTLLIKIQTTKVQKEQEDEGKLQSAQL